MDNVVAVDNFSCTANNFTFMYSQKRFSQPSLLISTTYFQNRIIMFCLELLYSAENKMQSFGCQHREQHIYIPNYEITVVQEIHISRLGLQILTIEFVIPFLNYIFGIWDRGLANSFSDHVIQISVRQMYFQFIFSKLQKVKVSCEKPLTPIIKYLFSRSRYVFPIWILIFDNFQAQINSVTAHFTL